jgi:UDPglucose--hexose-1-phosphate uridylyltransferase
MTTIELVRVFSAWQARIVDLKRDGRLRAVVAFKNHGSKAGARLAHPHSQLVATPIVPPQLADEVAGAARYHEATGRCVYCDLLAREAAARVRVVVNGGAVSVLAAYAARSPFELWVVPAVHGARFEDAPAELLTELANALHVVLARIDIQLERPAYNLALHSAPFGEAVDAVYHWHLEVTPRVLRRTGFEVGSGAWINPVSPEEAANVLRTP